MTIRNIGSGNIGATNVLRTGNKATGRRNTRRSTSSKASLAVLHRSSQLQRLQQLSMAAGALPILPGWPRFLGHLFPVWLAFKGGKGVATYIGVLGGIWWPAAVTFCAVWLLTAWATRYSSLSALVAALAAPLAAGLFADRSSALLLIFISILLIWKHHDNIRRLRTGEEPKIGAKS